MAALVRWNSQRNTWQFVDRPPKGQGKPITKTLGPTEADRIRGQASADDVNAERAEREAPRLGLSEAGPLYGEAVLTAWYNAAKHGWSPATCDLNERLLRLHVIPFFRSTDLRRLQKETVMAFGKHCGTPKERGGAGLGEYAVETAAGLLSGALRWCVEGGLMTSALRGIVHTAVRPARTAGAKKGERQAFNVAEIETLLRLASPELRIVCIAALHTGARFGELLALTWPCVNFDDRKIRIEASMQPKGRGMKSPKNGKVRVIDMSEELAALLHGLRRDRLSLDRAAPAQRIFQDSRRKPWTYTGLSNAAARLLLRAHNADGTRALTFHSFRHTFVSMAIANGADITWIAQQVGDRMETMLKHYTHFIEENRKTDRFSFLRGVTSAETASPVRDPRGVKFPGA